MIFLEIDNVDMFWNEINKLKLHHKYKEFRFAPIKDEIWGRECFMHDPSGILWQPLETEAISLLEYKRDKA